MATPIPGISGSHARAGLKTGGGSSWNWSDQEIENIIATEITEKMSAAPTHQEKLETLQNTFNDTMDDLIKSRDKLTQGEEKKDTGQSDIERVP